MIFVTVGTQLAFPRLIDAMEDYAAQSGEEVIAQTGPVQKRAGGRVGQGAGQGAGPGRRWPHLDQRDHLEPAAFDDLCARARVLVAHAGIGTILSARRFGRPLIILARRHALGEHRNDHQLATSRRVADFRGVYVVQDANGISALLSGDLEPARETDSPARTALITRIKSALLE